LGAWTSLTELWNLADGSPQRSPRAEQSPLKLEAF